MPTPRKLKSPPPLPEGAKAIPDAPGYAAMPDGQIISCRGIEVHYCWWKPWTPLKRIYMKQKKYPFVSVRHEGKRKLAYVHKLVLLAFNGPPKTNDLQACHNDGDADNAAASNLRWGTFDSNLDDKRKHGTITRGEAINTSKLTPQDVIEIRRLFSIGVTRHAIARQFGVYFNTINMIVKGKSWTHIR